jgi:DNA-binding Lrp family transcriptional regulator
MNVIKRYTSLLDLNKIGIHVRVLLLVKADKSSIGNLQDWLMEKPPVNWLTKINGEWKLVAECLFQNIKELESFTEDFEKSFKGVQFSVHYILEDLKRESFLAGEVASQRKSIQ